ncbi:HNH endonuclease [Myroides odoratimimus]|uniref:HNH endonuclease n=1 Tax=Myroides odoratimimus TaxID=76832 RepID=UPI00091C03DF|nr:HNH endonuclease [Myroides odoratimimus]SHM20112.1 HNH endonuclease [Myroides odoratimimus subsp. xuanwuensis]
MNNCYLCGELLESHVDSSTKNHYEHIIPQALGGQLQIQGILCKICGGEKFLGGKIDKPFCDIFTLITERLDIKKDRKTNSIGLEGKLHLIDSNKSIDVILQDNVLSNKLPEYKIDYDKKIAYVFANDEVAKNYKFKVKNELKKQVPNPSEYSIEIVSSLNDFLGVIEFPFNLVNSVFEQGLTKIAIEFALSKGVSYDTIKHLVDRENKAIKCNNNVIPYYPIAKIEEMMEFSRTSLDKNFMSHSLVLFSQRQVKENGEEVKKLYCFIELFGTFQYFVELNNNYVGKNIEPETYAQRIIRHQYRSYKIHGLDYKDLVIVLKDLGLDYKDVDGLSYEEVCVKLQNTHNKKNNYVYDYEQNANFLVKTIIRNKILRSNKDALSVLQDLQPHFYWNIKDDTFHITFYRSRFMKEGEPYSLIPVIKEKYVKNKEEIIRYTNFKFKELMSFIEISQPLWTKNL